MLKQGIFMDNDGEGYWIYEQESTNSYRFDICVTGATYHTEPGKVLYGMYKNSRTTYVYGDRGLKERLDKLKKKLVYSKAEIVTEPDWRDGVFFRKQTKAIDSATFSEVVEKAGQIHEELYRDGVMLMKLFTVDESTSMSLIPFNINQYEALEIGGNEYAFKSPYVPLEVLKLRFNLDHIAERDYEVVSDIVEARKRLAKVRLTEELLGIDTETTGLDFHLYAEEKLVGVILSETDGVSTYFPFAHTEFENLPEDFLHEIEEVCLYVANRAEELNIKFAAEGRLKLTNVARDENGKTLFFNNSAHNKKYERKVFMKVGYEKAKKRGFKPSPESTPDRKIYECPWVNIPIPHDSMQLSVVASPVLAKGAHALKTLTEEIRKEKYLEFENIFLDKSNINFSNLPKELVKYYACPDSDNIRHVMHHEWDKLPKDSRFIYELECKLAEVKAEQEFWGWRIDTQEFIKGYNMTAKTIKNLEEIIHILARWPDLKISSGEQLSDLLYNRLKCKVYVTTKTNKPSTGSKALKKLAAQKREESLDFVKTDICDASGEPIIKAKDLNAAKYPIVLVIEKYKEYVKLMTAFYHRIEKNAIGYFNKSEDGVISMADVKKPSLRYFFWINQNGASTGRQSSPMHQLPKKIKKLCLPDSSDHRLLITDYSQIELRIFFSFAGEKEFIEMCKDHSNDIHRVIDSIISNLQMWEISADMRKQHKQRNFGVVYLMSGMGLATQMYGAAPSKEQVKECEKSIHDLFHTFKRAQQFIQQNRKDVMRDGYMRTKFGRYAYFDKIFDEDLPKEKRESLIRRSNNMPVQGTAADIMKMAEVNMYEYIHKKGWDKLVETPEGMFPLVRVMLSAHDEAPVSFHKSVPVEELLLMIRECMEMTLEGWAPLFGSSQIVDNWMEGKDDKYAIPIDLRDKMIEDYQRIGKSVIYGDNIKEDMLQILSDYRDKELKGYMEDLIVKSGGESLDKVVELVKHPSLTHELISRFSQSDEHKHKHGKFSHMESIRYAVEQYFEFRHSDGFILPEPIEDEKDVDAQIKNVMEEVTGMIEELTYMDNEGNIVYEDADRVDEEDDILYFDDEAESIEGMTTGERNIVWETLNYALIDFEGLSMEECNEGLQLLYSMSSPDGYMVIDLIYNGDTIHTTLRADKLDTKAITEFVVSKLKVRNYTT